MVDEGREGEGGAEGERRDEGRDKECEGQIGDSLAPLTDCSWFPD